MTPNRWSFFVNIVLFLIVVPVFGQNHDARIELRLGVAAYDKAAYKDAVRHLKLAVSLDPSSVVIHLRLADAYNELYCENYEINSASDARVSNNWHLLAIGEYNRALELDPSNTEALNSLPHCSYIQADFDEAGRYYSRAIEIDPVNSEALYTLGVIDWQRSYRTRAERQAALGVSLQKSIIGLSICSELRELNTPRIEDGLELLDRALQVLHAPEAMDYIALLYRERAETDCGDSIARQDDLNTSEMWVQRACRSRLGTEQKQLPARWPAPPPPTPKNPCAAQGER